jgi:hypothetical protein
MLEIGRREKKRKEGGNERWAAKMLGRGELCRGLEKKGKGRERKLESFLFFQNLFKPFQILFQTFKNLNPFSNILQTSLKQ